MLQAITDFFMGDTVSRDNYLYDTPHIIALVAVFVITFLLVWWAKKQTKKTKDTVLWSFFGILLTFEIISRVINLLKGKDVVTTIIPMHFCSIMVWVMIIAILLKNRHLLNIAAMGGLIATTAFLVYPAVGFNVEVLKFSQYYSVISHCLGFVLSVFLLTTGYTSYRWKDIWSTGVFVVLVYGYSFLQNFVWYKGSNYMYYMENILPISYGWFLALYVTIVTVYFLSFYIIYGLLHKQKQ